MQLINRKHETLKKKKLDDLKRTKNRTKQGGINQTQAKRNTHDTNIQHSKNYQSNENKNNQ